MTLSWSMSSPREGVPLSIAVGLPEGARLTGWFADDASERDLTGFMADLLLEGLVYSAQNPDAQSPQGTDEDPPVPVATLDLSCEVDDVVLLLIEPASATISQLPVEGLLDVIADGIALAVTRAVEAAQAADATE